MTGISISSTSFRTLVADYLGRMATSAEMSREDLITMIRLWNTIEFDQLGPKEALFQSFADAFFPSYAERASIVLHALPTKGMALYSKEHDIFIGGTPHPNSQYRLDEES